MVEWFKNRSLSEKIMMGVIIMLLIGVIMRRDYIKKEGGDAIKRRLELIRNQE